MDDHNDTERQTQRFIFLNNQVPHSVLTKSVSEVGSFLRLSQYIEKLELEGLKSMKSDVPCRSRVPTVYNLKLPTEEVKLKVKAATCYFFPLSYLPFVFVSVTLFLLCSLPF